MFGPLSQGQVDGFNTITAELGIQPIPLTHSAYILATAWHETGAKMVPLEEIKKGDGHAYGKPTGPYNEIYYGRGYVQLTWEANYKLATQKLRQHHVIGDKIDLEASPELALKPDVAAAILVFGMTEGWFTGKKLSDYADYLNMRKVVNGTDKADLVAHYAIKFEKALKDSGWVPAPADLTPLPLPSTPSAVPPPVASKPIPSVSAPPATSGTAAPPPKPPSNPMPRIMAAIMALISAFVFWYTSH